MRISDWSSDVCSSDLLIMPFIGAGRRIERDERGEEPVVAFAVRARAVIPRIAIADAQVNLGEILVIDDRVPHGAPAARGLPPALCSPRRSALARDALVRTTSTFRPSRFGTG